MYMQKAKTLRTQEENTMKRAERNEFTCIWKNLKGGFYGNAAILTIPVEASKERILYMKEPEDTEWTELYTKEELEAFDQAIEA
jgi:hypothetical protein